MSLKTSRKLFWGLIPLTVIAIATIVFGVALRPAQQTAQLTATRQLAVEMRGLKHELISGHQDAAESIQRPDSSREGSPSSAEEQFFQERAYPASDVPANGYADAFNSYTLLNQAGQSFGWKELGPLSTPNASNWGPASGAAPISGRATALVVDPSSCSAGSCSTIYLGTAGGGIWKTTTAGHNWIEIFDGQRSESIGALAIDPNNPSTIYAGTGEPNNSGDSNRGAGIMKSTNGGHTWTVLGFSNFVNRAIGNIVVDPTNGNIYAISYLGRSGGNGTASGSSLNNPYLPPVGFYRSTDGGQTWTASNPTATYFRDPTGRQGPVSLVRASNGTLYLGVYAQGLYKSSDNGLSWSAMTNSNEPQGTFDRVTLAVAPSDPNTVYAAYSHIIDCPVDAHGNCTVSGQTFYQSTDGGQNWTERTNTPGACDGQCWYDMPVAVSPTNPNEVYVGGSFNYNGCPNIYPFPPTYTFKDSHGNNVTIECDTVIMKSTDGGATWSDIGYQTTGDNVHPDDHAILPTTSGGLFTANDGGLYHSSNDGSSWQSLNNGIGSLTFQGVSVNTNGDVFGGTQDNGTWMLRNSSTNGVHIQSGDGGMTAADPNNPNIVFDEFYGAQMQRFDVSTGRQTWMTGWWCDYFCFNWGQFYEPIALGTKTPTGASASNVVFSGTNRLWRSTMGGGVDGNHDGDATNDPSDTTDFVPITPRLSANISVIGVDPNNPNRVAIGTTNGRIYYTTNALASVQLANLCAEFSSLAGFCAMAGESPTQSGADACAKPWTNNLDTSTFCDYVSGVTWTRLDLSATNAKILPNRVVSNLTFDAKGNLFVTFSGFDENTPGFSGHVFTTSNASTTQGNTTWTNITHNLPDLPVNDLVENPAGHLFVAADYGVFISKDGGASWQREDYTLANSPVYDLALSPDGSTLYAATHGRGIWRAHAP